MISSVLVVFVLLQAAAEGQYQVSMIVHPHDNPDDHIHLVILLIILFIVIILVMLQVIRRRDPLARLTEALVERKVDLFLLLRVLTLH